MSEVIVSSDAIKERAYDTDNFPKYIPPQGIYVGTIPWNYYCRGWNSKREKYCRAVAGQGTDHLGAGRCRNHGGSTPIRTGVYSGVARGKLKEHLDKVKDQEIETRMDLGDEVDLMRALVAQYVERYQELVDALLAWNDEEYQDAAAAGRKARPQKIPSMESMVNLLEKVANTKDKIHAQLHRDSIPKRDFFRLQEAQADIAANKIESVAHIIGQDVADRLIEEMKEEWLEIRL